MSQYGSSTALALAIRFATLDPRLATLRHAFERRDWRTQPRIPPGSEHGGEWTFVGGSTKPPAERVAQALEAITKHAIDQIINRSVSPQAIVDALENPIKVRPRPNGTTQYIGAHAGVVLNSSGGMVTAWSR